MEGSQYLIDGHPYRDFDKRSLNCDQSLRLLQFCLKYFSTNQIISLFFRLYLFPSLIILLLPPQSAIVGSRVTLPCRVENKVGNLQWTKDDFGLGMNRNLSGYDRYAMIGSDEEGIYYFKFYYRRPPVSNL